MKSIYQLLNADSILDMPIEDIAYTVLTLANENLQNGLFNPYNFVEPLVNNSNTPVDYQTRLSVERAVNEAFAWLKAEVLVAPSDGPNGNNGWCFITRRGLAVQDKDRFKGYQEAAAFPRSLLHPKIAGEVWADMARGDLATAVFRAFRSVEEAVRHAAGFTADDIGVKLMRNAFGPTGPLTDKSMPSGEQDALMNLFAGAIGSYKNPHSHRTVTINEVQEAQEMVMLASHLLRIVDARRSI